MYSRPNPTRDPFDPPEWESDISPLVYIYTCAEIGSNWSACWFTSWELSTWCTGCETHHDRSNQHLCSFSPGKWTLWTPCSKCWRSTQMTWRKQWPSAPWLWRRKRRRRKTYCPRCYHRKQQETFYPFFHQLFLFRLHFSQFKFAVLFWKNLFLTTKQTIPWRLSTLFCHISTHHSLFKLTWDFWAKPRSG